MSDGIHKLRLQFVITSALVLLFLSEYSTGQLLPERRIVVEDYESAKSLGEALFFDQTLSKTRRLACSSCHSPEFAYSGNNAGEFAGAVSIGDDGLSVGDRNAPSLTYANQIPEFHRNENGEYVGGLFLDGRSPTLLEQVREPLLNPREMAMSDEQSVVNRVLANPRYVSSLGALFGTAVLDDSQRTFDAVVTSIAAYEGSESFATFDSKYDRYTRGEYAMSREEEIGRLLFFSQLTGCQNCHLLNAREAGYGETFSNHKYYNIGVPPNNLVRSRNGIRGRDTGLLSNANVVDPAAAGKFRVPSLRNVAVTGPYMHNGVFAELETAIIFYDKYLISGAPGGVNPETGRPWRNPEVPENIAVELLQQGQPITAERAAALAAFLRTLTDRRFEHVLKN